MFILNRLNKAIKESYSLNEANYGMSDEDFQIIEKALADYVEKHAYLKDYNFELYADYNDELSKDTIAEIFESEHPVDAFHDIISGWNWDENADTEYDEIFKNLEINEELKEVEENAIKEYIRDKVSYSIPYEHYDTTVGFDVFFKDPDNRGYYDDLLVLDEDDYEEDENGDKTYKIIDVEPELERFLKTQGHTKEELINYINEKKSDNKFFDKLVEEIEEATYKYGNQFVFLGQASLLDMAKAIQEQKTITIPVGIVGGLENCGNGSGSMLDIVLEKPITGKIGVDFEVYYKDGYHYNVDEINGLVSSCWNTKIEIGE